MIFARRAASSDWRPELFPPKPPPTYGVTTRTFFGSRERTCASRSFVGKGVWVAAQTVSFPPSNAAVDAWGSIGAWAT